MTSVLVQINLMQLPILFLRLHLYIILTLLCRSWNWSPSFQVFLIIRRLYMPHPHGRDHLRSTNHELRPPSVTFVRYGLMLRQIANGEVGLWMWWTHVCRHTEQPKRQCPPAWWLGEELHIWTRDEMLHIAAVVSISVRYFTVFIEMFKITANTFSKSVIWKWISI